MSKRAVTISYEMLKEFLVKGNMFELVECIEGIPEDAICIELFPDPIKPWIIMVLDSVNWEGEPNSWTSNCPISGTVPCQDVKYKRFIHCNRPSEVLNVNGQRFKITSKTPIQILHDISNDKNNKVEYSTFCYGGDWQEMEMLT